MKVEYRDSKLERRCNIRKEGVRAWGPRNADLVLQRIQELVAAPHLDDFCKLPGPGCHPLIGNRQGQWGANLAHPMRLVLKLGGDESQYTVDGQVDRKLVTEVQIWEVEDYHG